MNLYRRRWQSVLKWLVAASFIVLAIGAAALYLFPGQIVTLVLPHLVGRHLTFTKADIRWGSQVTLDLDDIHVANRSWGTEPDFFKAQHIGAKLDLRSLLLGSIKVEHLTLSDAHLLLERNSNGVGDWKNTDAPMVRRHSPLEEARHSRVSLPPILDMEMDNSGIKIITSSKAVLMVDFEKLLLRTPAQDQPVTLTVTGAYNKLPVQMEIDAQSFDALHDASHPFKASAHAYGNDIELQMDIAAMDPLNFDQFTGTLHADTKNMGSAAAYFGSAFDGKWPSTFDSKIERQGDKWIFSDIDGVLAGNKLHDSRLDLNEGARLQPDSINAAFAFDALAIDSLISPGKTLPAAHNTPVKMPWAGLGDKPSTLFDVMLSAKRASFRPVAATNLKLHGVIAAGTAGIPALSFDAMNGQVSANLNAVSKDKKTRVEAALDVHGIDTAQLQYALNLQKPVLTGSVNVKGAVNAEGDTLQDVERTLDGRVSVNMARGDVKRWANHLIAGDVGAFFDNTDMRVPVRCLNAVVSFKKGIGTLSPFVFQTSEGTLLGQGIIDLPQEQLSLLFYTDPATTSALALDVPVEITGKLSAPTIHPRLSEKIRLDTDSITCSAK